MDFNKFYDFFQPEKCKDRIHIIGCGAVGSTIGELLVRMGIQKFTLWDLDIVEPHNIANQMFRNTDILRKKTEALADIMMEINPDIDITIKEKYEGQPLNGYVFMAVDKISVRKEICDVNRTNINIKALFDARIRLTDAQGYAARWNNYSEVKNLINSMNFTDEEADSQTPMSACNMALSVAPTVRLICNLLVADFMNLFIASEKWKTVFLVDAFNYEVSTF
ncbi:ThiF family adenylyltransferase [Anaerovoracaceae bacterium 41-7]